MAFPNSPPRWAHGSGDEPAENSDFTDDDGGPKGHPRHSHEPRDMAPPVTAFAHARVLQFASFPSPRLPLLNAAQAAHERTLEKQHDVDAALVDLRERYHALVDKWVDLDGSAANLSRGALQLASEVSWRRRGRPVHQLVRRLAEVDGAVDEGSLRSVSLGVATLRRFDWDVSDRLAWAKAHPPCKRPGCPDKARDALDVNGSGGGGVGGTKGRGVAVEVGRDGAYEVVSALCHACAAAGAPLPSAAGYPDGHLGGGGSEDGDGESEDPDWERLEELRAEALEKAGLLTDAMHQFSVEAAAGLRHSASRPKGGALTCSLRE
jgi:hypothetical protein